MNKSVEDTRAGIDRAVLARLELGVGRDTVAMLVAEFLQTVGDRLALIEVAANSADLTILIRQAHDLGTEAGSLGLVSLFAAARDLESAGRRGDASAAVAIGRDIRLVAAPQLAEIKALFPDA